MSSALLIDPAEIADHVAWLQAALSDDTREVVRRVHHPDAPPTWSDGVDRPDAVERAAPAPASEPDRAAIGSILGLLHAIQRAGRATEQGPYEAAYAEVFEQLDALEALLAGQRWLLGGAAPTAADWWLFALLVRFDVAWNGFYRPEREGPFL